MSNAMTASDPRDSRSGSRGNYQKSNTSAPSANTAAEAEWFNAWLDTPTTRKELKSVLPDNVSVESFVRTAKQAVLTEPKLLTPAWRGSHLQAIAKAAAQGLMPDGKHGALVPRQQKAGGYGVSWQPMVWGIMKLARQTGAVEKINAKLVFYGEKFEIDGAEDRIIHKVDPDIVETAYQEATPAKFMERVQAAYCIFTAPNGTQTMRWMTRARINRVKAVSQAGNGPWNGSFADEMILKTVILYTAKWIETNLDTVEMTRFRDALETDMEADFDADPMLSHDDSRERHEQARISSEQRVAGLEEQLAKVAGLDKEKVPVGNGDSGERSETSAENAQEPPAYLNEVPPADDFPGDPSPPPPAAEADSPQDQPKKSRSFSEWLSEIDKEYGKARTVAALGEIERRDDVKKVIAALNDKQRQVYIQTAQGHLDRIEGGP
jgi:phage RecT family recombinase